MRSLPRDVATAVLAMVALTLICGVLYPLLIDGVSQAAFPGSANGQLLRVDGRVVGSALIGENLGKDPRFFQTRPSGTTPADNAAATAFANLGPNSTITLAALKANIAAYIALNGRYVPGGLTPARVPVDAADTSASGIDPDISPANAAIQAHRVAAVDHLPLARVMALVRRFTGGRGLGFLGEPTVDVPQLNLAIDRMLS